MKKGDKEIMLSFYEERYYFDVLMEKLIILKVLINIKSFNLFLLIRTINFQIGSQEKKIRLDWLITKGKKTMLIV